MDDILVVVFGIVFYRFLEIFCDVFFVVWWWILGDSGFFVNFFIVGWFYWFDNNGGVFVFGSICCMC